jgi:hypothetical protein
MFPVLVFIIMISFSSREVMAAKQSKERWAIEEWLLQEYIKGSTEMVQYLKDNAPEGFEGTVYCLGKQGDDRFKVARITYEQLHSSYTVEDIATALAYAGYYTCEGDYQQL